MKVALNPSIKPLQSNHTETVRNKKLHGQSGDFSEKLKSHLAQRANAGTRPLSQTEKINLTARELTNVLSADEQKVLKSLYHKNLDAGFYNSKNQIEQLVPVGRKIDFKV